MSDFKINGDYEPLQLKKLAETCMSKLEGFRSLIEEAKNRARDFNTKEYLTYGRIGFFYRKPATQKSMEKYHSMLNPAYTDSKWGANMRFVGWVDLVETGLINLKWFENPIRIVESEFNVAANVKTLIDSGATINLLPSQYMDLVDLSKREFSLISVEDHLELKYIPGTSEHTSEWKSRNEGF